MNNLKHNLCVRGISVRAPGLVVACCCATTLAQPCAVTESNHLIAPQPAIANNQFGASVAIDGDWAIVGAPGNDQTATDAGAAYVLHRQGGQWNVVQTLLTPAGTPNPASDAFGSSVALNAGVALVGAPGEVSTSPIVGGAVHVYVLNRGIWEHAEVLIASDTSIGDQFGTSVALDGGTIVVGAINDDDMGSNSGSVYVFKRNGSQWIQSQKLNASDGQSFDNFGFTVAVTGDVIVIGAPGEDDVGSGAGAAYAYAFDGLSWNQTGKLLAPDGGALDAFGTSVSTNGSLVVIGAPGHDVPMSGCGAAYAFAWNGLNWAFAQKMQPDDVALGDEFGSSVALQGEQLVIGAQGKRISYNPSVPTAYFAGSGYLFASDGGLWHQQWQMRKQYIETDYNAPPTEDDMLGYAAALDGETVILGAPMRLFSGSENIGSVSLFDIEQPDCDGNGVPDVCEADCNRNVVADVCELLANSVDDCNSNGVPDECESEFEYIIDTGIGSAIWGAGICPADSIDMIWLNQFHVVAGGQRINRVAFAWLSWVENTPGTILIYDDPNNDGDPSDAVLLSATPATTYDAFGLTNPVVFTIYEVPSTDVGDIGESFFVGMHMSLECGVFPAVSDTAPQHPELSWRLSTPIGSADLSNPTSNAQVTLMTSEWAVRAAGFDCDGNGVWDQCDIDGDPSLDLNNNGIIDSCDLPCPGDIAGPPGNKVQRNGAVDIDDLLVIVNHWGQTGPPRTVPGDIFPAGPPAGDGLVNIDDLLIIINTWGSCP